MPGRQTLHSPCRMTQRTQRSRLPLLGICLALVSLLPGIAHAQISFGYNWSNSLGGSYANFLNWNSILGGVPDADFKSANFSLDATYTVQVNQDYSLRGLYARGQGKPTLSFSPPSTLTPRKIYSIHELLVDPTNSHTVSLGLAAGDIRVDGSTVIGGSTSNGNAELLLANARLTTVDTSVAVNGASQANITVDPFTAWNNSGQLLLGDAGDARLDVAAGSGTTCFVICVTAPRQGSVISSAAVLANGSLSEVEANVFGHWNTGNVTVANAGNASLQVFGTQLTSSNGINVSSVGTLQSADAQVGAQAGSHGSVDIIGSAVLGLTRLASDWSISGNLALGGTLTSSGGEGRLTVGPSNKVSVAEAMRLWPGATLHLLETSDLTVAGEVQLNGTLEFSLLSPSPPSLNATYPLFTAGSVSGQFQHTLLPDLAPGLRWQVQYNPTDVTLRVVAGVPGDYNNNGSLDAADFTLWRDALGSDTVLPNDSTPGTVTNADYLVWKNGFLVADAIPMTVPETLPGMEVIFLLTCLRCSRFLPSRTTH